MRPIHFVLGLLIVVLGWYSVSGTAPRSSQEPSATGTVVTVYKSPSCSCCGSYASYLETQGYGVVIELTEDMTTLKSSLGVPATLESCHTSMVEGYIIEGHVPVEAIKKLLTEQPDIKGIGLAGMPSGSPGMPGPKEDFLVYTIEHDGTQGELFIKL